MTPPGACPSRLMESEMSELHCWADGPSREVILADDGTVYECEEVPAEVITGQWWGRLRQIGSTCLLPADHGGPHEWTPDDTIEIRFK